MQRIVVITGASSGIGAALARQLGSAGHVVVLGARRADRLNALAAEIGTAALAVPTDVTRRSEVEHLRDAALEQHGRIDVWVNNAGRGIMRPLLQLSDDDFDTMMAVNVKSALYGMQAVVPHFQERGSGHIINVSSFLGRVPLVTVRSAYNAAKAALGSLTANLRMELRNTAPGVHVSLVMPGMVTTDFAAVALGAPPTISAPVGIPTQTADEVAALIANLIEHPAAELYTQPGARDTVVRYFGDPAAFEGRSPNRPA